MKVIETDIPDVLILEPQVYGDERGFFMESFNQKNSMKRSGERLSLFKTTILSLLKTSSEDCIIKFHLILRVS